MSVEGRGDIDIPLAGRLMRSSGRVSAGSGGRVVTHRKPPGGERRKEHPEDP